MQTKLKKVYIFGNEYVNQDNFAHKVAGFFKKPFKHVHCESPDFLFDTKEKDITIIDVVQNIEEPLIIVDADQVMSNNIVSLHDFDLGFTLKLLKKLGKEKNIKIIGIPSEGDPEKIAKKVEKWI